MTPQLTDTSCKGMKHRLHTSINTLSLGLCFTTHTDSHPLTSIIALNIFKRDDLQISFIIDHGAKIKPCRTSSFISIHYALLNGRGKVIGSSSECCGPRYFDKQLSDRLKGNRDLCAPRKSIESDYLEREQVESQGGPCHVYNLSLPLCGAIAVSPVSAVSG